MTGDMSYLPEEYLARMSELLKDEYEDFLSSYSNERTYGLRINPLKVDLNDEDKIKAILTQPGCNIDPEDHVTWCDEGYYYNEDSCPGRSPYHEAGAYYIQEPSAMAVTSLLDPQPGERALRPGLCEGLPRKEQGRAAEDAGIPHEPAAVCDV